MIQEMQASLSIYAWLVYARLFTTPVKETEQSLLYLVLLIQSVTEYESESTESNQLLSQQFRNEGI
jgi:hypothetical protein